MILVDLSVNFMILIYFILSLCKYEVEKWVIIIAYG